jgi:hypothetical protein
MEDDMIQRMIGVLKLDVNTFEEIEHDQGATTQAATVVIIAAIASGIGTGITSGGFVRGFLGAAIGALVGWFLWAAISFFIGTRFMGGEADLNEMLRVVGFAYTPQILGIIPWLGVPFIASLWSLIAGFIAVRQGLDLDNMKAALTVILGILPYLIIQTILNIIF